LNAEKRYIKREEVEINSLYYELLCRISEYHKEILEKEEKARSLVMTATPEQLQAIRAEVLKVTESYKDAEKDSNMQKFLLNRLILKLESTEKHLHNETAKLEDLSSQLADVEHARKINKL
jgi:hypothetical protein